MFSHITVGSSDLDRSGAFYDGMLLPLGLIRRAVTTDGGPPSLCWVSPGSPLPRFYVYRPYDRKAASSGNGSMVAFQALSEKAVRDAYAGAMAAGGRDEGPPGSRPHYGDGYYGAYVRDPDGNKIHIVFRGDLGAGDR